MEERILRAYFEEGKDIEAIAGETGIARGRVMAILGNPRALEPYRQRAEAAKLRAQIVVNENAVEAARKQAELLHSGEEKSASISQRAAKDILDRAGIRVSKDDKGEITVRFTFGMPELGMPRMCEEAGSDGG